MMMQIRHCRPATDRRGEPAASVTFNPAYLHNLQQGVAETENHFAEHFGRLLDRVLRRRLRCPALIEDVRQETLTRVLIAVRRGQVHNPERLDLFVIGVSRRVVFEQLRQQQPVVCGTLETEDVVDEAADPLALAARNERTRCVRTVLDRLPQRDRDVLRFVYLDGDGRAEISRRFGTSDAGLRILLHRARSRFRTVFRKTHFNDAAFAGSSHVRAH